MARSGAPCCSTSAGVRYPSAEWRRCRLENTSIHSNVGRAGLGPGRPRLPVDQFSLEGSEEACSEGIIIAVVGPTHGHPDPLSRQGRLVGARRVLAPPVGVIGSLRPIRLAVLERHLERCQHQVYS